MAQFSKKELAAQADFIEENQYAVDDITMYTTLYLQKAIQEENLYHEALACYYTSLFYRNENNIERAQYFIDRGIALAKKQPNNYQLGLFLHRKGTIFYVQGHNTNALEYYIQAYDILKNENTALQKLLNLQYDIATIKLKAKHYREAATRFETLAHTYDSLVAKQPKKSYYTSYIHVLAGLAEAYTENEDLDDAMEMYNKALHLSIRYDYTFGSYVTLGGKGKVLNRQKEYQKALLSIDQALQLAISDSISKAVLPFLYAHKGESFYGLEKYEEAIYNFSKADSIITADALDFIELEYVSKFLAQSYSKLKNYEKASQYFNEYAKKNNLNTKERIQLRRTLFNDFELQELTDKLAIEQEEKGIFKNSFYISILIIFCLLGVVLTLIMRHRYKQKKSKKKFEILMEELSVREQEQKKIKTRPDLSDDTSKGILQQLEQFETKQLFLNKRYNLSNLAKEFQTNPNYLSKVINTYKEKSFSQYIIDLRINFILIELKNNKKLHSYTIQAVAEEAGFNKAESFARAFKKKTGFNPSYYIKTLKQKTNL
ncbi:MAG: helix-turn-helix domain-containing protein [Bacteroidota bacterium]